MNERRAVAAPASFFIARWWYCPRSFSAASKSDLWKWNSVHVQRIDYVVRFERSRPSM
jgi:hypothetical protein